MKYRKPVLGRTSLKLIAVLTMLCDHFACVFLADGSGTALYRCLRIIGRVSFPIFCFLLVQGFLTSHDIKKYGLRLLLFAFLSEIPFDLAFSKSLFNWSEQNVMFTLFIALLVLYGMAEHETNFFAQTAVLAAGCLAAYALHTDYSYFGIILTAVFYLLRNNRLSMYFWSVLLLFLDGGMEVFAVLALPVCECYRPECRERKLPKYFFYAFYPVHLLIFWGIRQI